MRSDVLIVIPARGGSKGIPKKNLQYLTGLPLFGYSVVAALETNVDPHNILVSSDDENVLAQAEKMGVVAHRRPDEICTDTASTELALIDAWKARPDCKTIVTLQPTSPLRKKGLIEACLSAYETGDYDSLVTTTKFYPFFWKEQQQAGDWSWISLYDPQHRPMRQAIPRENLLYFDNGNVYISDSEMLNKTGCRLGSKVLAYTISDFEGLQIDTQFELDMFRCLFRGLYGKTGFSGADL